MTRRIAVVNQKGGVGKTTTSVSIAACAAEAGLRVLHIDLDPQAHSTNMAALPGIISGLRARGYTLTALPAEGLNPR